MKVICLQCNKEFKRKKGTAGKFCSYPCYWKSLIGVTPWNKGTVGIMKPWNKGKKTGLIPRSAFKKGQHVSEKTEFKKGQHAKEKHPMWKGGITPINNVIRGSVEYKLWSDSVFSRDNHECQRCGYNFISKLVAHHILNFSKHIEIRFAIDNGITFCRPCHKEFHSKYGKRNNCLEQVIEFINK